MKKTNYFLLKFCIIFGLIVFSCSKNVENEPITSTQSVPIAYNSIQEALDDNVTIALILTNNPIDSLYGKTYNGGLIFYVDSINATGLISTNFDQSINAEWGCESLMVINSSDSAIGFGLANTTAILAGCSTPGIAAHLCSSLTVNGYSDWFLPSYFELEAVHNNLHLNGYGNFALNYYWSSTEVGAFEALIYPFNGIPLANHISSKSLNHNVRAIRAF